MSGTIVIPAVVLSRAGYCSIVYLCFVSRSPDWNGQAPDHHAFCESFLKKGMEEVILVHLISCYTFLPPRH